MKANPRIHVSILSSASLPLLPDLSRSPSEDDIETSWYAGTPRSCNNHNHGRWRVNRCHQCPEVERDPARLPSALPRDELEGEGALGGGVGEGAVGAEVVAEAGVGAGEMEGGGAGETARAEAGAGDGARAGGDEGARAEEGLGEVGVFRSSGLASTSSTCS